METITCNKPTFNRRTRQVFTDKNNTHNNRINEMSNNNIARYNIGAQPNSSLNHNIPSDSEYSEINSSQLLSFAVKKEPDSLSENLKQWAIQHNISHSALHDLLNILKDQHPDLPSDPLTILNSSLMTETETEVQNEQTPTTSSNQQATLQSILFNLTEQNKTLKTLKSEVDDLKSGLNHFMSSTELTLNLLVEKLSYSSVEPMNEECVKMFPEDIFPIASEEQLEEIEDKIKTDMAYRRGLVRKLGMFGGINSTKSMRTICKYMFCDNLLMEFSWLGTNTKKNFGKHKYIFAVIVEAVRVRFPSYSDSEAYIYFKTYLKQARFRLCRSQES